MPPGASLGGVLSRLLVAPRGDDGACQIWHTPRACFQPRAHVHPRIKRIAYAQTMFRQGFAQARRELLKGQKTGHWIWWVLPTKPFRLPGGGDPTPTNMAYEIQEHVALQYLTTPPLSMLDIASFRSEIPVWSRDPVATDVDADLKTDLLGNLVEILCLIEEKTRPSTHVPAGSTKSSLRRSNIVRVMSAADQPKVQSACQLWLSVVKGVGAEREQRDRRFARLRSVCTELLLE